MKRLACHALAHLRDVGALPIAYAQMFSVPRLRLLRNFQALTQPAPVATKTQPGSSPDSGTLNFDWLTKK